MINKIVFLSLMAATGATLALLVSTFIFHKSMPSHQSGMVIGFKTQLDADNFAQQLQQQNRTFIKIYMGPLCSISWNDATEQEYKTLITQKDELGIRCIDSYGWLETTYAPHICFDSQESLHAFTNKFDQEIEEAKKENTELAWYLDVHGSIYKQEGTKVLIDYPALAEAKYQELQGREKECGIVGMHLYS